MEPILLACLGFYINLFCANFFSPPLLLKKVFQTRKEMVIKKTVARLPLSAVLPLVEEVSVPFMVKKQHFVFL